MAHRLTPIERAIAGEPTDRRRRYDRGLAGKGLVRVTAIVPAADADRLKAFARELRAAHASDASPGGDDD